MIVEVEVMEEGQLRVSPGKHPKGTTLFLTAEKGIRKPLVGDGSWESIQEVLDEVDQLDIPRRSHEEILHDLHTFRETI